ncbi:MAG: bifunctional phosphoribosylaminoimidazolecarboxamide formyltransferase/IMP cyclohydrolase [Chloroflexi bacterium]|nr:bifunctional phosphoribosylaminoimidazolecarboxamide formyltransferase/IMP cyclohydrolase [Chloroflexota bacterium]
MRALISVSDKTGVVDFARGLSELGVELFSTGGTEALLRENSVEVKGVQELTGFPEILGGRVKTLHPLIYAGILALRQDPGHIEELERVGAVPIDIVAANLYPFREAARRSSVDLSGVLENIDIGGVTLLRAAAKNFAHVVSVCDPMDYSTILDELREAEPGGTVSQGIRRRLAAKAFQHCAVYDTHIAGYLRTADELFPDEITLAMKKIGELRYGENPHQLAAFYADSSIRPLPRGVVSARQVHGKQLSFNNTYDLDAAWRVVADFSAPTVCIIKHGNPCGLACGDDLAETFRRALAGDPQSAFGGAVATNRTVDEAMAREIADVFFEDLIAPDFTPEALAILQKKRDLRIMATGFQPERPGEMEAGDLDFKRIVGGWLTETRDALPENMLTRDVVTTRQPTLAELTSLLFAWRAVKHVHSNGIVLARGLQTVGMGAGQPSRVDAVDLACRKANDRAVGSVMASDAFFPFPDGIERAAIAGVTAVIQPGGSIRDQLAIEVANRHHMAMIFTHQRHFKH